MKYGLLYTLLSKVERLDICNDQIKRSISCDDCNYADATHVVVEITWGANSLISVKENKNLHLSSDELRDKVKPIIESILQKDENNVMFDSEIETVKDTI